MGYKLHPLFGIVKSNLSEHGRDDRVLYSYSNKGTVTIQYSGEILSVEFDEATCINGTRGKESWISVNDLEKLIIEKVIVKGELYSSKNSRNIFYNQRTNRRIVAKSAAARGQEKDLLKILPLYRKQFLSMLEGLEKPYKVQFKIYRATKRRFDLLNIVQNLVDCMVKCGWLVDDNANEFIPVFVPYEVDRKNPRVEISVIK